jgi:hypothetical protein
MSDNILVVFSDDTDVRWLKGLRHGYRHCFVVMETIAGWVSIDPLLHRTEIIGLGDIPRDTLEDWLKAEGYSVVPARIAPLPRYRYLRPAFSCVGHIKRILGIATCRRS